MAERGPQVRSYDDPGGLHSDHGENERKRSTHPALCQTPGCDSESPALVCLHQVVTKTRRDRASVGSQVPTLSFLQKGLSCWRCLVGGGHRALLASGPFRPLLAQPVEPDTHSSLGMPGIKASAVPNFQT